MRLLKASVVKDEWNLRSKTIGSGISAVEEIGDKTKAIYCIKITMENGLPVYKKELLETRNWDDKMYLYPIPQTEYYKNPNLGQNTGW